MLTLARFQPGLAGASLPPEAPAPVDDEAPTPSAPLRAACIAATRRRATSFENNAVYRARASATADALPDAFPPDDTLIIDGRGFREGAPEKPGGFFGGVGGIRRVRAA